MPLPDLFAAHSQVAAGYERVAEVFDSIHDTIAPGGSFAAVVRGEVVVDLWAGARNDAGEPWRRDTLAIIASGTKGVATVAVLMALERELVDVNRPLAMLWPEFAQAGKANVTIAQALAHLGGVPGISARWSLDDLRDSRKMSVLLAAEVPLVPILMPSYHAITFGWIAAEIIRRVDGRSLGQFVADEIAGPLDLDIHIGASVDAIARTLRTSRSTDYQLSAFLPGSSPDPRLAYVYDSKLLGKMDTPEVLACEIPGGNAVANANSMARLYGALVSPDIAGRDRLVSQQTLRVALTERSSGADPLSGRHLRFGIGFELNPNPSCLGAPLDAFGHTGAGGSAHGAWPSLSTGFSYVMREFRPENNDGRARRLLDALHRCVVSS